MAENITKEKKIKEEVGNMDIAYLEAKYGLDIIVGVIIFIFALAYVCVDR